jgi:hypothetical protein
MAAPVTIPLTWNLFVTQIATMAVVGYQTVNGVVQGVDAAVNVMLPQACQYVELRAQRDLDILPSLTSNGYQLTPGNNTLAIGSNDFVTLQTLGVTVGGVLTPLLPASKEFIQTVYGDPSYTAQPLYFAMIGGDAATGGNTYNNILVGPYPDINYPVAAMGTVRLPSLALSATPSLAATGTTFLSTYYPDLMIQGAMIYVSEYQRQFGATANDPQMPGTYESNYQTLVGRAIVEEARKKFQASAWSSMSPPSVASASR